MNVSSHTTPEKLMSWQMVEQKEYNNKERKGRVALLRELKGCEAILST